MGITLDIESMKLLSLFEKITRSRVKDCVVEKERILFIVQPNEIAKSIGKHGSNVKRLEQVLKRKIKIVEFNPDIKRFINNLAHPAKIQDIVLEGDGVYVITAADSLSRGMMIGRGGSMLRWYEDVIRRYFPLKELKVK